MWAKDARLMLGYINQLMLCYAEADRNILYLLSKNYKHDFLHSGTGLLFCKNLKSSCSPLSVCFYICFLCLFLSLFFLTFSSLSLAPCFYWGRSQSAGRLSDVLLMAAFGGQRGEKGSTENLNSDRAIDITGEHINTCFIARNMCFCDQQK